MNDFAELIKNESANIAWHVAEEVNAYTHRNILMAGDIKVAVFGYNYSGSSINDETAYVVQNVFSGKKYFGKTEKELLPHLKMIQNTFIKKLGKTSQ